MGVSSCCSTMCVINSFFGIPLQTAVKWIGIFKLVITLILAITCIVGQTQVPCMDDERNFLDGGSIECIGPYIRQICFDFFLPMTCALLLIFGARQKSSCLLLTWFIIVFCCYVQYLWVVFASDWDRAEDWVAICYVVHYTAVAIVVYSFMKASKRNEGVVHNNIIKTEEGQAAAAQATTTITVQQQPAAAAYPQQQPQQLQMQQQQQQFQQQPQQLQMQQQQQFQQKAPYDPNMAGYAPPQPGYPGAPPVYAPQAPYAPQNTTYPNLY